MDANRFFSIPYDATHDFKIRRLKIKGGGIIAYGRWVALLGMLYDEHGLIDLNDNATNLVVQMELELLTEEMPKFFELLAEVGLIDSELYHSLNHVVNSGVCEELEYRKQKSEAGKKGLENRWGKGKKPDKTRANSNC